MSRFDDISVETLSASERKEQESLLVRVDGLLEKSGQLFQESSQNFVEIGLTMSEVKKTQAWMLREHSWDKYVQICGQRFSKGRTVLYNCVSVAERLLPTISKEQLIDIGISKAQALAGLVKKTGKPASAEMLAKASDGNVGVEEFRAVVADVLHEKPENAGKWRDFGGAFMADEEWKEWQRVVQAAKDEAGVPADLPDWMKTKLVMQTLAAECLSSWGK